jgi:hydroxymethylglutaryl-CoA reductase
MHKEQSPFPGFSKHAHAQRLSALLDAGALSPEDIAFLNQSVSAPLRQTADHLIENMLGCFPLPLGVGMHFLIDGQERLIPMAVEESSVIAAASATAKWIRAHGRISTDLKGGAIIGQIHIPRLNNAKHCYAQLAAHRAQWIAQVNEQVAASFVQRGGGVNDIILREIPRGNDPSQGMMGAIHVLFDPCDAMGANMITQICEYLKPLVAECMGQTLGMAIVSNLVDTRVTQAEVVIDDIDATLAQAIAEASLFAQQDPYRAATSNKGVLNGIDALLIATGNDWRAVDAGVHAYAAQSGQYRSVTQWHCEGKQLIGRFEAPVVIGTVGGVTRLHPTAQLCLKLLGSPDAKTLSRIAGAVGLVQNLGALRALVTDGIVSGHMRLHLSNLIIGTDATPDELPRLKKELSLLLKQQSKVTQTDANQALQALRAHHP